jgi:LAO/AO transport system kinase
VPSPFDATVRDLENMLALGAIAADAVRAPVTHATSRLEAALGASGAEWTPPIVKTVASKGEGTEELMTRLAEHRAWTTGDAGTARSAVRAEQRLRRWLRDALAEAVLKEHPAELSRVAARVLAGEIDPDGAVDELVDRFVAARSGGERKG